METLEGQINKYNFPPELIFNFDETALDFTAPKLKVVSRAGKSRPFVELATKGEHITLGLCISASGSSLRPLVILPLKTLPSLSTEVTNFYAIAGSDAGFITKELWFELVVNNLIPEINKVRLRMGMPEAWALMIVDGHNSRDLAEAVELFLNHRIILGCMPAHSSTICQPLDLSVNGIFKVNIRNFFKPKEGESVPDKRNRVLFLSIYALQIACNAYNVQLGFSRAGIHPFSKEAPLKSRYIKSPFVPTPPPVPPKGTKRRSISGRVLTPENTLRGLPPTPPPKKRAPRLKSAPQRRPAILPPPTNQIVPINFTVSM
jgi:DDE superfamily endonuclease